MTMTPGQLMGQTMGLDDFFIRAIFAGLGLALATAPLGCLVVWRRMAFFGDATAHAAILGVALALAIDMPIFAGALIVALAMAILVSSLGGRGYASDTLLGVLAHSSLALGLVAVSFMTDIRVDLIGFLFGDILAVTRQDLLVIWLGGGLVSALVWWRWSAALTVTISPDLAQAAGLNPRREALRLNLALAVTVAIAIKVVGALLIAAMLVIPAAAARPLASTPERMVLMAGGLSVIAVIGGLNLAFTLDTPAGPTIVSCLTAMFLASSLLSANRR